MRRLQQRGVRFPKSMIPRRGRRRTFGRDCLPGRIAARKKLRIRKGENSMDFLSFLKNNIVVFDGAFGTLFQIKTGVKKGTVPEKLKLSAPELIA